VLALPLRQGRRLRKRRCNQQQKGPRTLAAIGVLVMEAGKRRARLFKHPLERAVLQQGLSLSLLCAGEAGIA
jgi:hypothetical protein